MQREDVYRVDGPVNLVRLMQVADMVDAPVLKFRPLSRPCPVRCPKKPNCWMSSASRTILLHHPYQSFQPVIDLLNLAASDPDVVAIKMTVYRRVPIPC